MIDWQQIKTADVMARLAIFQAHLEQGGLAAEDAFQMLDSIHAALEQQHGGRHLPIPNTPGSCASYSGATRPCTFKSWLGTSPTATRAARPTIT